MKMPPRLKDLTCSDCELCRSRPNTLDRFLEEYENTESYCDQHKKDMGKTGILNCQYLIPVQLCGWRNPMMACDVCGYYTRSALAYGEGVVCRECRERQFWCVD
jgi:hypothetical protein